jgi:hypothetical protein
MPVVNQPAETVEYRYFVCDFLTNELLAEIPFTGVSYGRALREAGSFEGSIAITEETFNLSLYENTLPGKTALYVVRNNVCVWGGLIWTRNYDIATKTLSVSGSEMTSYLHHRIIWKTWSNQYASDIEVTGGIAKVTINPEAWQDRYTIKVGEPVYLDWGSEKYIYRNTYAVLGSTTTPSAPHPSQNVFYVRARYTDARGVVRDIPNQSILENVATTEIRQDTYDYARGLLEELVDDMFSYGFPNDAIEPGIEVFNELATYRKTGNLVRVTTKEPHELVAGQKIKVADARAGIDIEEGVVSTVFDDATFEYENTQAPANVSLVTATERSVEIGAWERRKNIVTIYTYLPHGFEVGDIVFISNLSASVDGFHTILNVDATVDDTFSFAQFGSRVALSPGDDDARATVTPSVIYSTWGPFKNNGNFGLTFNTVAGSGQFKRNSIIRGFELKTVGEVLAEYSNVLNGFEYRIDSSYLPATGKFKNTFTFLPIVPPSLSAYLRTLPNGVLPAGQFAPIEAYGADKLIFEYPGNVSSATLEESAEDSATRFWVQGNDERLKEEASQPYSGASDQDMLFRGWPILEQSESINDISDETELYEYAARFLIESKPPISNFTISVNGSLIPKIGSYSPGDWCGVIINDDFVRLRLQSYIELNDGSGRTVLLRKIDAFNVSVPDNPAFPEQVSLELVTEAEVDKIGN